jgi:hypothetical protein
MKLLTLTFLFIFISCEEGANTQEAQGSQDANSTEISNITDVTADYYGTYQSDCIADSDLEFGQGKEITIILDAGSPVFEVKEYGEATCLTLLATRSYDLAFEAESVLDIEAQTTTTTLEIEYISSTLRLSHSAYNGYNSCGFTASLDIDYVLASPCEPNLDGNVDNYLIEDLGASQFSIQNNSETITLTKQ